MAALTTGQKWLAGLAAVAGGVFLFDKLVPVAPAVAPWKAPPPRATTTSVVLPATVKRSGRAEALAWIRDNPNKSSFASNTLSKRAAIDFVQRLYALGARSVVVSGIRGEAWRIDDEGGPSADTLFVKLPNNQAQINAIANFVLNASDTPDEFSRVTPKARIRSHIESRSRFPEITPGQLRAGNTLRLWWD